ncbi:hypothetical protein [Streptomyces spiramenti]|uniref:hypothetical protein n=1 Tax=Streptomyces spiramenti TaxID=2720606 RepID=UPI003B839F4C
MRAELCDVILTAMVALASTTDDPERRFRDHLDAVARRAGSTRRRGEKTTALRPQGLLRVVEPDPLLPGGDGGDEDGVGAEVRRASRWSAGCGAGCHLGEGIRVGALARRVPGVVSLWVSVDEAAIDSCAHSRPAVVTLSWRSGS